MLSKYGPETGAARDLLRLSVVRMIDQIWATNGETAAELNPTATRADILYDKLTELSPRNDGQRSLQAQAQKLSIDLAQTRWLLFEQGGSSIPVPFLILLIFWVTIIFLSFGLFAPSNATVIVTLFLCALSVSGAIFLIMELDRPFSGVLRISETPLRNAVTQLGQ
jgi:membrane-bound ClpP family serine protease